MDHLFYLYGKILLKIFQTFYDYLKIPFPLFKCLLIKNKTRNLYFKVNKSFLSYK